MPLCKKMLLLFITISAIQLGGFLRTHSSKERICYYKDKEENQTVDKEKVEEEASRGANGFATGGGGSSHRRKFLKYVT